MAKGEQAWQALGMLPPFGDFWLSPKPLAIAKAAPTACQARSGFGAARNSSEFILAQISIYSSDSRNSEAVTSDCITVV